MTSHMEPTNGFGKQRRRNKKCSGRKGIHTSNHSGLNHEEKRSKTSTGSNEKPSETSTMATAVASNSSSSSSSSSLPTPKRPMNAYNFFYKEQREIILGKSTESYDEIANGYTIKKKRCHQKTHGKITLVELAKTVGKLWRNLNECEIEQYKILAYKDGERYRKDLALYKELSNKKNEDEKPMIQDGSDILVKDLSATTSNLVPFSLAPACEGSTMNTYTSNKTKKCSSTELRTMVRNSKKRKKCNHNPIDHTSVSSSVVPTIATSKITRNNHSISNKIDIEQQKNMNKFLYYKKDIISPMPFHCIDTIITSPTKLIRNVSKSTSCFDISSQIIVKGQEKTIPNKSFATIPFSKTLSLVSSDVTMLHPTFSSESNSNNKMHCKTDSFPLLNQKEKQNYNDLCFFTKYYNDPLKVEPINLEEMKGRSMESVERSLFTILTESDITFGM